MASAPNILLVMSDQHRADMLGCAGDASMHTPTLDRLAGEGVRFSRVSCQGPLCMPSRASFMTERYVRDHGVYTNWAEIPEDSPTYARALREAGLPHLAPGQGPPLPATSTHRRPHRRHGAAPRGVGLRRGLRDRRQVHGQDTHRATPTSWPPRGCSTPTERHIADRSLSGGERGRAQRHQVRAHVGRHPDAPAPLGLRRHLARGRGRALARAVRAARALLPLRRVPGAARSVGRAGRGGGPLPRRRHLHALLDHPARRSRGPAATSTSSTRSWAMADSD